jgi:hypothetical protein
VEEAGNGTENNVAVRSRGSVDNRRNAAVRKVKPGTGKIVGARAFVAVVAVYCAGEKSLRNTSTTGCNIRRLTERLARASAKGPKKRTGARGRETGGIRTPAFAR